MEHALNIITIASAVLLILVILIQTRGASLGSGFGGTSEIFTTRRGSDKILHQFTILLAIVFALSIILSLI